MAALFSSFSPTRSVGNVVSTEFSYTSHHFVLLGLEHSHSRDDRSVVTPGHTDMREEFTSLAFLAITLVGVALFSSGLLALVILG
ncbi:hypothetical protein [Bradyrhizobium sp. CCBAU 51627]|uniref:hypothetical protein n=1 Tax=Bradyrhizobium sp. CCBAU 51627 TaxID=1325088 RepID=UPI002305C762|nr:hypothetical protein [Bradyrhizobium sp. CCBAU 51627]